MISSIRENNLRTVLAQSVGYGGTNETTTTEDGDNITLNIKNIQIKTKQF